MLARPSKSVVWIVLLIASLPLTGCQRTKPIAERPAADRFSLTPAPHPPVEPDFGPSLMSARAITNRLQHDLVIGSWNIKWFGQSQPDKYDYETMADFVEECDVVAVQELTSPNHTDCLDALVGELWRRGHRFRYDYSMETGYRSNPDSKKNNYLERYAYLWNEDRLDMVKPTRFVEPPAINNPVFRQVPVIADFKVKGRPDGFDFRLLNVHTVYNKNINHVRRAEIEWINTWMTMASDDGEQNLIAVGDFNANPAGQPHHFAALISGDDFRVLMYESESAGEISLRTTVPKNESSSNPTYLQKPVYDHAFLTEETSDALPARPMTRAGYFMGVYDFDNDPWWKANGWTREQLIKAVSDHRPIWFKLMYDAADAD